MLNRPLEFTDPSGLFPIPLFLPGFFFFAGFFDSIGSTASPGFSGSNGSTGGQPPGTQGCTGGNCETPTRPTFDLLAQGAAADAFRAAALIGVLPIPGARPVAGAIALVALLQTAIHFGPEIGTVFQQSEDGDDDTAGFTDKPGKIANETGKSVKDIRMAIEKVKQKGLSRATNIRNPDVKVNPATGDVRPIGPDGSLGDSIGNIFDFL